MQEPLNKDFGIQFKRLRLSSQIVSLAELGKLLANYGYIYEDSILSHWQNGRKIPKRRDVLLTILHVFNDSNKLSIEDANRFLATAGQGYLTDEETKLFGRKIEVPFLVPPRITDFTGRKNELQTIYKSLESNRNIYIKGQAGIGKTSLAIEAADMLKDLYKDGVLWYRIDLSNTSAILSSIAQTYGSNINTTDDLEIKASLVRSLLSNKNVLMVFDNVDAEEQLKLLLPNTPCVHIIVTSQKQFIDLATTFHQVDLSPFSKSDLFSFYEKLLEKTYILKNKEKLEQLAEILGYLPLSLSFTVKQIKYKQLSLSSATRNIVEDKMNLKNYTYLDKNLYNSPALTYKNLEKNSQSVLYSMKIFTAKDFSMEAIAAINDLTDLDCGDVIGKLKNSSLLEQSTEDRYRLHPAIKKFISTQSKKTDQNLYTKLVEYYCRFLELGGKRNASYYKKIETEFDNISSIFDYCLENKKDEEVFTIWNYWGPFLWDNGYWNLFEIYSNKVILLAKRKGKIDIVLTCYLKELLWLHIWQEKIEKAEELLPEIDVLLKQTKNKYFSTLYMQRKGFIFLERGKTEKAEKLFRSALTGFEEMGRKNEVCDTLTYLGHVSKNEANYKRAIERYTKAYKFADSIKDVRAKQIALRYLGDAYLGLESFANAEKCFREALLICKLYNNKAGRAWNQRGLALSLKALGKKDDYKKFQKAAYKEFISLGMEAEAQKINAL